MESKKGIGYMHYFDAAKDKKGRVCVCGRPVDDEIHFKHKPFKTRIKLTINK